MDSTFDYTEIWASTTNDRAAAVMVGITRDGRFLHNGLGNAAIRYYWARTRSVFGEYSTWYPVSATAGVMGATVANPSELITLLNKDVDQGVLADYIAGKGSFSDVTDTFTPAAIAGVGTPGTFATKGQMLMYHDKAIQMMAGSADVNAQITLLDTAIKLKVSAGDLSTQVDILSTAIGLKLNQTGTPGAGMLISAPVGGKSQIQFWSDCLQICLPDGTGVKPLLTTGLINGVGSVGISGDMVIDGTLSATKLAAGELIVGTNVALGTAQTAGQVTTIVGNTVNTGFVNALNVTADSVKAGWVYSGGLTAAQVNAVAIDAGSMTTGTLTGRTIQTAAPGGKRFVVSADNNQAEFWGDSGAGILKLASIGIDNYAGLHSAPVACFGDTAATLDGVVGVSGSGAGITGVSVSGYGAWLGQGRAGSIYRQGLDGFTGASPCRLAPGNGAGAPTHNAEVGSLWVDKNGILYIQATWRFGNGWQKVGAQ